ncbi:MAG TPA: hypothetical protein VGW35_01605 [Methylomirabilota bacterium]|nr:hypothetical protein [Methylomirabilota bacterium]
MRAKWTGAVAMILVLAVLLAGCIPELVALTLVKAGLLLVICDDLTPIEALELLFLKTLVAGTLTLSGRMAWSAASPEDSPEPQAVPRTVRFIVQRKSAGGQVLQSQVFPVSVRPDGTIPAQSFRVPATSVPPGQRLELFLQSAGGSALLRGITLNVRYSKL